MILYFFDSYWNILGKASYKLPRGVYFFDDIESEDVETGTATFDVTLGFDEEDRMLVKTYGDHASYIVFADEQGQSKLWTIIDDESDELQMIHQFYAEDAGMDLINETLPEWGEPSTAQPISFYINKAIFDSGFEIGINEIPDLKRTLKWDGEATALNRLQSILTQFDNAELQFRFDVDRVNLQLKHKYIDVLKKRGNDTEVKLRMDKEVKNIKMKRTRANMFNAFRCYGATPEGKDSPVTLSGYKLTDQQKHINAETGKARFVLTNNILKDTESNAKYSRYLNPGEQGDGEGYYTGIYTGEASSQKTLADEVINKLKKTSEPEVNFEVEVIDVPIRLNVGDYVFITNNSGEQYLQGRILKTERRRSKGTFDITLGDYLIKDPEISAQIRELAKNIKGKDGISNFIFYAYADDEKGTGFSLTAEGKSFTGLATSTTNEQPIDPSLYTWNENKGQDGTTIKQSTVQYAISDSATKEPAIGWIDEIPEVPEGKFLWTKTELEFSNGEKTTAYTYSKQAEDGKPTGILIADNPPKESERYNGMIWKNTNANNNYVNGQNYIWNAAEEEWTMDTITAESFVGKTFKGFTFETSFDRQANEIGDIWVRGLTKTSDGETTTEWERYTKKTGKIIDTGVDSVQPGIVFGERIDYDSGTTTGQYNISANGIQLKNICQGNNYAGSLTAESLATKTWIDIRYEPGYTTAESNPCQYRIIALVDGTKELQLRGQARPTSGNFPTNGSPSIAILPVEARPSSNELLMVADSTKKGARVGVLAGGNIQVAAVNGSSYISLGGIRVTL